MSHRIAGIIVPILLILLVVAISRTPAYARRIEEAKKEETLDAPQTVVCGDFLPLEQKWACLAFPRKYDTMEKMAQGG